MANVIYETRDRIGYVTLNRPEALNAQDDDLNDALWQVWAGFDADDSVDVAIVTGAGKAFCSGADLKSFIPGRELGAEDPRQRAAGDPVRQGDDPGGHRPPAGRRAEAGNRQRIFERRGFPGGSGEAAEVFREIPVMRPARARCGAKKTIFHPEVRECWIFR
jgi:hypothetical protein